MTLDTANGWFDAAGIPITPYDDAGAKNFYPTARVTAIDIAANTVLATTITVLPVGNEITRVACHASRLDSEPKAAKRAA